MRERERERGLRLDLNKGGVSTNHTGRDMGTDGEELVWERLGVQLRDVRSEF